MKRIIIILAMTSAMPAMAQNSYSLNDCRRMATDNNYALRSARNASEQNEENSKEAYTKYFPKISASGVAFKSFKNMVNIDMNGQNIDMIDKGAFASISAVQPIFQGGQIINSNKLAKVNIETGKLQIEQTGDNIILNTEQYYWQIIKINEKQKTLVSVQNMLNDLKKEVSSSVKAGVTNRNDLLQVNLRLNDIKSQQISLENTLIICKMQLAQYCGFSDCNYQLSGEINSDNIPAFPNTLKTDHLSAVKNTNEYKLLEKNVEASELQRKLEVGKNLPSVGIGVGMSYNDLMGDRTNGMVFATVSIPISDWWGGSHAIKRKKLAVLNAKDEMNNQTQLLQINMENNWLAVVNAHEQLEIAKLSIEQSEENLRLNRNYYKAGMSKMSDVLDAEYQFQNAHDKFVDAFADYQQKITEYKISINRK